MQKWTYRLAGAVGALAIAAGSLLLAPAAWAADAPEEPVTPAVQRGMGRGPMGAGGFGRQAPAQRPAAQPRALYTLMADVHDQVQAALAEELGMTVEELDAAFAEGKTLATLAAEKDVDAEALLAAVTAARNAAIDELVADGTLDADVAERFKAFHAQRTGGCLAGDVPGAGYGRGMGMGGRGQGFRGGPGGRWNASPNTGNQ